MREASSLDEKPNVKIQTMDTSFRLKGKNVSKTRTMFFRTACGKILGRTISGLVAFPDDSRLSLLAQLIQFGIKV